MIGGLAAAAAFLARRRLSSPSIDPELASTNGTTIAPATTLPPAAVTESEPFTVSRVPEPRILPVAERESELEEREEESRASDETKYDEGREREIETRERLAERLKDEPLTERDDDAPRL